LRGRGRGRGQGLNGEGRTYIVVEAEGARTGAGAERRTYIISKRLKNMLLVSNPLNDKIYL